MSRRIADSVSEGSGCGTVSVIGLLLALVRSEGGWVELGAQGAHLRVVGWAAG